MATISRLGQIGLLMLALLILWVSPARAADAPSKTNPKPQTLDFEADIIEGQKLRPDLLVQVGNQPQALDAVIYGRASFNDFARPEMLLRPRYLEIESRNGIRNP